MNKLTKLLVLSSIASATLFANDNLVIDFEKKRLSQNPNVKASNIKIFYKKELEAKGWYGYVLDFDAVIQDKNMKVKDTLLSDGKVVATDLFDITTSKSLKSTIVPNITDKYYQKSKLVAGSEKAKDKIVLNDRDDILLTDILREIKKTLANKFECIVPVTPKDNLFDDYEKYFKFRN